MAQRRRQREFEASLRPVSARELCVGCILWLPEKVMGGESVKCILSECRCNNSELESDGYKHYVVVLDTFRINDEKIKCYVAKLTSQTGTRRYMIDRIEISQDSSASSSLDEPGKLYLEHGSMPKQSFVSLNHAFQISPKLLRTLKPGNPAYDRRLTEQSYTYLMEILGLRTALYEDTDRVRQSGATIPTGIPEIPTRKDRMEAPILHTGYPATASVIAPTAPMAILALPNSMAELGSWNSHQSRASSSAHNLSATQTSTPTPHDPDHEALSKAFMLSSQPKTSRAISPTSRAILNHPPTRSTNREPNTFEPSRENRAQRSATETDPLLHRSPKVQGLERKAVRAPDLESGAHHRRRNGPGLTYRCSRYFLDTALYALKNATWKKICWVLVVVAALHYTGILRVVWLTVKVLGGWLKGSCLWTGRVIWNIIKFLAPRVKDLVFWAGKAVFVILKFLARFMVGLLKWAGNGVLELLKSGVGYLGFG